MIDPNDELDVLLKLINVCSHAFAAVKFAIGRPLTITECEIVSRQLLFVTAINVVVYVPATVYE